MKHLLITFSSDHELNTDIDRPLYFFVVKIDGDSYIGVG